MIQVIGFFSIAETKVAEVLESKDILFFYNSRFNTEKLKTAFIIFSEGKWGILVIEDDKSPQELGKWEEGYRRFQAAGVSLTPILF